MSSTKDIGTHRDGKGYFVVPERLRDFHKATLCNMKLSIAERVPIILFDTDGNGEYWKSMKQQVHEMVDRQRAPGWIRENIVITDDPNEVIDAYRERIQLF